MKKYIHDYQRMLERETELIKSADIPSVNRELIFDYRLHADSENHSIPRILRVISILRLVSGIVKKPFTEVQRRDYELLFSLLRSQGKTQGTIDTYKNVLRVFHRWLNQGEFPECVKWFKFSKTRYAGLPQDLLTAEDVKKLLQASSNLRDKAMIAVLWESGARVGEVGTLEIRHISFDDFGCQAMLDGKTGQRRIRLVSSAPYLLEWINIHPFNSQPDANLWINNRELDKGLISYRRIAKILEQTAQRAGIKKPINPHHFRHSRATYNAQFLTEAQMKEYFGWKQDSDMAARYVHLSGKQVDDAILKMYGLKKQEDEKETLKREACPRCKNINDVNHQFCQKCWLPLTNTAAIEAQETQSKDQKTMVLLMKFLEEFKENPESLERMLQVVKST